MLKNLLAISLLLISFGNYAQISTRQITGQSFNAITKAVPFLNIVDNATVAGLGNIGVVATDYNYLSAFNHNPAHITRGERAFAAYANHTPWLRQLVPETNIANAGILYSPDGKTGIAYSLKYIGHSELTITTPTGTISGSYKPNETAHSLLFSRLLSKGLSVGLGLKYFDSKLLTNYRAQSFAGDIGVDYTKDFEINEKRDFRLNAGASALNLGDKISYHPSRRDFIPSVLKAGVMGSLNSYTQSNNKLTFSLAYQAHKLLVPTPGIYNFRTGELLAGTDPNVGVIEGILGSFSDAPGIPVRGPGGQYMFNPDGSLMVEPGSRFREELQEIVHHFGFETRYLFEEKDLSFIFRAGYMHESENKGNRKIITTGIGASYKAIELQFAYYHPTTPRSPLASTFFLTASYQFLQSWNVDKGWQRRTRQ
jgi:hypothetical protein